MTLFGVGPVKRLLCSGVLGTASLSFTLAITAFSHSAEQEPPTAVDSARCNAGQTFIPVQASCMEHCQQSPPEMTMKASPPEKRQKADHPSEAA